MPEITLADLLAWETRLRPHSPNGASDRAASDGWAERELTWAVTIRASAPMLPAIRGGELVLLPQRVLSDAGVALPILLRELATHGISGVVLDRRPALPSPVPVLVADMLPSDFETDVNRLLTERRGELYRAGTDLGRLLTTATTSGADLAFVLGTAASFLGVPAAIVDARGTTLAETESSAAPPGRAESSHVGFGRGWRDDRFATRLAGGETLWLGPVQQGTRALVRLAAERISLAAEAAIQRAAEARPRGPARAAAVTALLSGSAADAPRTAAALGLPSAGHYRVALANPEIELAALHRALSAVGTIHEGTTIDSAQVLLVELRPEIGGSTVRGGLAKKRDPLAPISTALGRGWVAFSSATGGVGRLPDAAREARFVTALLESRLIEGPVARFESLSDLGAYRLLYRLWGVPDVIAFAGDALGDLPGRDRRGTLRHTLLAYLSTGGSHVNAAAKLGIHRNTLSYRLKQIAKLTGREPTDPANQLVFHLALLAASLPPAPPPP